LGGEAPLPKFARRRGSIKYSADLEVVYLCPSDQCNSLFIGYFGANPLSIKSMFSPKHHYNS
jgi:hypothetical protein